MTFFFVVEVDEQSSLLKNFEIVIEIGVGTFDETVNFKVLCPVDRIVHGTGN